MAQFPRYAVYFVPHPDDPLYRFGAGMLGYDAFNGVELQFPDDVAAAIPDWRELTDDPRKYGFHATLKAPMTLAPDAGEADLILALEDFADKPRQIPTITPVARTLSGFTAIVPEHPVPALNHLADACVTVFDPFRAALTPQDRARRNPARLGERQVAYLERWGYPYVFEEFRFHMTLTGRLAPERRGEILAIVRRDFARLNLTRLAIDRIALCRQVNPQSRFTVIGHWPLRAAS